MSFDPNILKELKELYDKNYGKSRLIPEEKLRQYYQTFLDRFGPEQLKKIDGIELLEKIHAHDRKNRDSLVYWLEFKDDEELPGMLFGSISGGSALKFGIYKSNETGQWMTGNPRNQRVITVDEAIERARIHRDQLIRGAELMKQLPDNATEDDYQALQRDMDEQAPDISDTAWGHKYFHMLYPDKLAYLHVTKYQKFYLHKIHQIPPKGDGRYLASAKYVSLAKELGIILHHLVGLLLMNFERPYLYWSYNINEYPDPKRLFQFMIDKNIVAFGYPEVGDLSGYEYGKQARDDIKQLIEEKYFPQGEKEVKNKGLALFRLATVIEENHIIMIHNRGKVLGICKVNGLYNYEVGSDYPHTRSVEWLSHNQWEYSGLNNPVSDIFEINDSRGIVEIEKNIYHRSLLPNVKTHQPGNLTGIPGRIQRILSRKGQVIIYGPPGTGKTYWAEIAARELAARKSFKKAFDELTENEKSYIFGNDDAGGFVRMCTFHPGYGYEDFIEGYRAEKEDKQLIFELKEGVFKKLCREASENPEHDFYLIIDEINRGDIPRIFGELLTTIEKNKRNKPVVLPYSNKLLKVPDNVYIIGTMNTADRSIALLDTALRRRFGFFELMPDSSVLGNKVIEGIPLGQWLDELNNSICEYVGRDARNLQIGHAYLMEGDKPISDFNRFARVIQEDIIPLLEEYCYEEYETLEKILGNKIVNSKKQIIRHELFEPANKDDLLNAILSTTPELMASIQAVESDSEISDNDIENDDEDSRIEE